MSMRTLIVSWRVVMRKANSHRLLQAALVLAAAVALSAPTTAQHRAVLISPNVVCRAVPSYTADALGVFRHMGAEGGMFIEIARRTRALPGRVGVLARSLFQMGRRRQRVLDPGIGHFPNGRILLAGGAPPANGRRPAFQARRGTSERSGIRLQSVWASLASNGCRRSPDLELRRLQLLERALLEVNDQDFAADDLLIIAWIESLGDQVHGSRGGLEPTDLAIVAPDVACRPAPAEPPTANGPTLQLDYHFNTGHPDTVVAGEAWTFVFDGCWVSKSLTAPGNTDEHVLAIANRFESTGDEWSKTNLLRAYNVLSSRNHGHRDMVEASAVLSLRRLEVLGRWLTTFNRFGVDPLTRSIVRSLDTEVQSFEPGGVWVLRDETFQNLYEQHKDSPDAHEILWKLANIWAPHDCEGEFACTFHVRVMQRWARYWIGYPRGPHVAEAISTARGELEYFLRGCRAAQNAAPESWQARWGEHAAWEYGGAEVAADLRASLAEVEEEIKVPLLDSLDELEACVAEVGGQERR